MSAETRVQTGCETQPGLVKVWDPFIRLFHWLLLVSFALAWYSGGIWENPHLAAGYCVAALVVARLVWGFVGSKYARFRNFVYGPQTILGYLVAALRMQAPRYLGHNPAGGTMVIALLATLVVICMTGVLMTIEAFWGVEWIDKLHNAASTFALVLVGLHVGGVIAASIEHHENLILSMITGWKRG